MRQRTRNTIEGYPARHEWILSDIQGVVIVDKVEGQRLTEHEPNQQHKGDGKKERKEFMNCRVQPPAIDFWFLISDF